MERESQGASKRARGRYSAIRQTFSQPARQSCKIIQRHRNTQRQTQESCGSSLPCETGVCSFVARRHSTGTQFLSE